MTPHSLSVDRWRPGDRRHLRDFCRRAEDFAPLAASTTWEVLQKKLTWPAYTPHEDCFVARKRDDVVGMADITPEIQIERVVVQGYVQSEYRKKGVGSELLRHAEKRAMALGAAYLHICVPEQDEAVQTFLSKRGFVRVRTFIDLIAHVEGLVMEKSDLPSGRFDFLKQKQEPLLAELQNRVFEGSWGFCPNSSEDIAFYIDLTKCRISDVLLMKDRIKNVGYSWFHKLSSGAPNRRQKARIHMFGILPGYRGRDFGLALLEKSLDLMKKRGVESIELTVDSENTAALSLYNRLGFKKKEKKFWYEKAAKL